MKSKDSTWISDITEGLQVPCVPLCFNDKRKGYRRIKFFFKQLTLKQMISLQEYIQKKRPEYEVTIFEWNTNIHSVEYCVYYRPKIEYTLSAAA